MLFLKLGMILKDNEETDDMIFQEKSALPKKGKMAQNSSKMGLKSKFF